MSLKPLIAGMSQASAGGGGAAFDPASPGPIGDAVPNTAIFTTLTVRSDGPRTLTFTGDNGSTYAGIEASAFVSGITFNTLYSGGIYFFQQAGSTKLTIGGGASECTLTLGSSGVSGGIIALRPVGSGPAGSADYAQIYFTSGYCRIDTPFFAVQGVTFPTSDPHVVNSWWDDSGTLTRSSG